MTDHEPHSADRLALDEKNDPTKARTQAFERWHEYLARRQREKAEKARKSA